MLIYGNICYLPTINICQSMLIYVNRGYEGYCRLNWGVLHHRLWILTTSPGASPGRCGAWKGQTKGMAMGEGW